MIDKPNPTFKDDFLHDLLGGLETDSGSTEGCETTDGIDLGLMITDLGSTEGYETTEDGVTDFGADAPFGLLGELGVGTFETTNFPETDLGLMTTDLGLNAVDEWADRLGEGSEPLYDVLASGRLCIHSIFGVDHIAPKSIDPPLADEFYYIYDSYESIDPPLVDRYGFDSSGKFRHFDHARQDDVDALLGHGYKIVMYLDPNGSPEHKDLFDRRRDELIATSVAARDGLGHKLLLNRRDEEV